MAESKVRLRDRVIKRGGGGGRGDKCCNAKRVTRRWDHYMAAMQKREGSSTITRKGGLDTHERGGRVRAFGYNMNVTT